MPTSQAITITSPGVELLAIDGQAVVRTGTLQARDVPGMRTDPMGTGVAGVGFNAELLTGLKVTLQGLSKPNASADAERGVAVMQAITATVGRAARSPSQVTRLRLLARWVPAVFYNHPDLVAFLDAQPGATKKGFLRLQKAKGRPDAFDTTFERVAAVRALLAANPSLTVKAACAKVKPVVARSVEPRHLRNLHSQLGAVVDAVIHGYHVPAEQLTEYPWGLGPDSVCSVYVNNAGSGPQT